MCVCVKDGRVEKEEEEEEPGGTDPNTRTPHNDVGNKKVPSGPILPIQYNKYILIM